MPPFAHVLAGFTCGFTFRKELAQVLGETRPDSSIANLDPARLTGSGITALALDFDGVLAPHGLSAPLPEAREWLIRCSAVFGANRIFILSNKPTEARKTWFRDNFPEIRFISGVRKKPYPDGLKKAGELARVPLPAILMVDDRLLTGCLAALVAGARPFYIRRPHISFSHRPLAELFFMMLRAGERVLIRLIA
jgi:predicted HAD superfamily phosphohydrolase YqeG